MSRGMYQLQAASEPGYRISIRGGLPKDGTPLHAGMVKTKSGWLTFEERACGHTLGAVHLAASGYLLSRSDDERVLLVREEDALRGDVDAKSLAWFRRDGTCPGTVSLESAACSGKYLTHQNYRMFTSAATKDGLACSFFAVAPPTARPPPRSSGAVSEGRSCLLIL